MKNHMKWMRLLLMSVLLGGVLLSSAISVDAKEQVRSNNVWDIVPSENPSTVFNELTAIDAADVNDMWAVGAQGPSQYYGFKPLIEHWDGTAWSVVSINDAPPTNVQPRKLAGVVAIDTANAWAVGAANSTSGDSYTANLLLRWNGSEWSYITVANYGSFNELSAIDASSPNDVWAVGGTEYPFDNTNPYDSDPTSIVLHWDGTTWQRIDVPNIGPLIDIAVIDAQNIWLASSYATLHWNGTTWREYSLPSNTQLNALATGEDGSVWSVGFGRISAGDGGSFAFARALRWNGQQWLDTMDRNITAPPILYDIAVINDNDVWVIGGNNSQAHTLVWNGTTWTSLIIDTDDNYDLAELQAITALERDVWTVGTISQYQGAPIYQRTYETFTARYSLPTLHLR